MNKLLSIFRDPELAVKLSKKLSDYEGEKVNIMEVCGTHTMCISRYGIRSMLPESINLISGPGCPVCVTPVYFINSAIELSEEKDIIITTFGDLMKVPGSKSSLLKEKAKGSDIRIVYSPLDAIKIAEENTNKKVVFLSVGFETTTPVTALTVLKAKEGGLKNFFVLSANKTMPSALKALALDEEVGVQGYLYPGHVSAIIGTKVYEDLALNYGICGVVTGFEPIDILHGILTLVSNINKKNKIVVNEYSRVVTDKGNEEAVKITDQVFWPCDSVWRGIGNLPQSGLNMREEFKEYDAWKVFNLNPSHKEENSGCLCGEILKGRKKPSDCKLYGKNCVPENPVGACMVSSEGTCAAYYRYGGGDK
ncbi:MAG: hydrogenase formation protein HypD [Bacillota bacterium]|nr:hydrogenase formation protein HypD [Bacillota bacterium]